jgi:hypothetical protein
MDADKGTAQAGKRAQALVRKDTMVEYRWRETKNPMYKGVIAKRLPLNGIATRDAVAIR